MCPLHGGNELVVGVQEGGRDDLADVGACIRASGNADAESFKVAKTTEPKADVSLARIALSDALLQTRLGRALPSLGVPSGDQCAPRMEATSLL